MRRDEERRGGERRGEKRRAFIHGYRLKNYILKKHTASYLLNSSSPTEVRAITPPLSIDVKSQ